MTSAVLARRWAAASDWRTLAPRLVTALAFFVLFWQPLATLVRDWWTDPDAGHGLLLSPVALYLAWRRGLLPARHAEPALGVALLVGGVVGRMLSGLAAEPFTMRLSLGLAAGALVVYAWGARQLLAWWLSCVLLVLSIPLPAVVLASLSLPLQLRASELGAALLAARHIPASVSGNIIYLPGRALFVTEACSGLRSLTALLALGFLIGAVCLRSSWARALLALGAIPIGVLVNGFRLFLTGFLVFFVSPKLGDGAMHYTEGWSLFVAAFAALGACAWALGHLERVLVTSP